MRYLGQRWFSTCKATAIEQFERHAHLFKDDHIVSSSIQLCLSSEQLSSALLTCFVLDSGLGTQLIETITTVFRQSHHALLVHHITCGGTVAQHARHEQVL